MKTSAAVVALGAVLAAPVLLCLGVAATLAGAANPGAGAAPPAVAGIPPPYLLDFEASGARFGVPWEVLAGIYRLECDFGTSTLPGCAPVGSENPYGAQGPGQFLPGTWRTGLAPHQVIPVGPPTASTVEGFATDGDGDGLADPWDPADAVASTARMLAADGAPRDLRDAVFAYNHSSAYVDQVLALASRYAAAAGTTAAPAPGGAPLPGSRAARVEAVLAFAESEIGTPYQWGGAGPLTWDCSGLVMVAYGRVGVGLPHDAALQYALTAADAVPLSALEPGDLVFFGPTPAAISHVGIYVGDGDMIDAPHTGAVVRVESIDWPDLLAATRPLG
jgi:cell wall-associated NlpC family hydrolase